jgi:glycogen(starch) synthase
MVPAPAPVELVTVCTPWYPTAYNRLGGSFVADWSALSARLARRLRVIHTEEWPGGTEANIAKWSADTDLVFGELARRRAFDVVGAHGTLTRVPTVLTTGWDVPRRAEAAVDATRRWGGSLADSPVVHGHVGYLGGLVGARLADPSARLVVTEHSTGLGDVLASPAGLELYAEVLERAHRLTCVSRVVRDQIVAALPEHSDKVVVVPNPVDFAPVDRRPAPPSALDRWVFAGGLIERKGVLRLLQAFSHFAPGRPEATLDLFGSGPLEDKLRELAAGAGLGERVRFRGSVPHGELLSALASYDVLLAPSTFETFHLVVPEAVAAGVPVVATRSGGPQEALAGVEDLVGRLVDVNDDPQELVDAVQDLEAGLGDLDLEAARQELDARYGPEAVLRALSDLYGVDAPSSSAYEAATASPTTGPPTATQALQPSTATTARIERIERIERVSLLSALGWRRYAIESEARTAVEAGLPTTIVTDDAGAEQAAAPARRVPARDFLASLEGPAPARGGGILGRLRRAPERPDADADHSTHVLTHVSGSAWAAALIRSRPEAELVIELDRTRLGRAPVDAP